MDEEQNNLKKTCIHAIFRFKSVVTFLMERMIKQTENLDLNMNELVIMKSIENNSVDSNENVYMSDIQNQLFVSKAAISQTLGFLEKKEYINRSIDKKNRRKTIVTLTAKGKEVLKVGNKVFDGMLSEIISRAGEDEIKKFVTNIDLLANTLEEIIN